MIILSLALAFVSFCLSILFLALIIYPFAKLAEWNKRRRWRKKWQH